MKAVGGSRAAAARAAQHAIGLEPNLGLGYAALGYVWSIEPRMAQAEEQYRRAIALGQPLGDISAYAVFQLAVGNIDKARAIFLAARETDPLNPTVMAFLVGSHHMLGDTPAALAEYERGRTLYDTLYDNHLFTHFLATLGRLGTARLARQVSYHWRRTISTKPRRSIFMRRSERCRSCAFFTQTRGTPIRLHDVIWQCGQLISVIPNWR